METKSVNLFPRLLKGWTVSRRYMLPRVIILLLWFVMMVMCIPLVVVNLLVLDIVMRLMPRYYELLFNYFVFAHFLPFD